MSVSSSSPTTRLISIDPRVYCETMNEIHSYITSSKRGYLTQAELFRYYRQRYDDAEIPYRLLGYRSLLDLLGSDQRLFTIDLRREPAYVYSAVKVMDRKKNRKFDFVLNLASRTKRERRRMFLPDKSCYHSNKGFYIIEGSTSFSRQHHSTNTLGEQNLLPHDYTFDHHVPLTEQQQENLESADEQKISHETQNERPLTPIDRHRFDTNVWHTPQLDEQIPLMDKKVNNEERNEEIIQFVSNPFLPLPTVRLSSEMNDSTSFIKRENQYRPIQRRILSHNDDYEDNKRSLIRDPAILKYSSGRLNRSISTSTTSLSKYNSIQSINSVIISFTIVVSFIFLGVYLYKCCFI